MIFTLTEPTAPRYIYVNPETNKVSLFMPVIRGETIGTDNTCESVGALKNFFGSLFSSTNDTILKILKRYKDSLIFDIGLLNKDTALYKCQNRSS